jgi:diaminohydroxyphosphoribosylaminopyrimidine deaminase / 5-amino-6-(5-phosphoribosylamino)uracil reductase
MSETPLDELRAWSLLRGLARRAGEGRPVVAEIGVRLDDSGEVLEVDPSDGWIVARPADDRGWAPVGREGPPRPDGVTAEVERLLDLYMPLCVGARSRRLVVAHLGQSLDGRIATVCGTSQFITGEENRTHAHRMRALFDVVLIGAGTAREDDPRLTTRLVDGRHPTRVVLDPARRLGVDHQLFQDGAAPTLLLCAAGEGDPGGGGARHGKAEVVPVHACDGRLSIPDILAELARRGLHRIFIEGGGVTVSRFLEARALDRLQVAVAPMILGSGRPAFSFPVIHRLSDAMTLACRHFVTGTDVLFDCVLDERDLSEPRTT